MELNQIAEAISEVKRVGRVLVFLGDYLFNTCLVCVIITGIGQCVLQPSGTKQQQQVCALQLPYVILVCIEIVSVPKQVAK